MITKSFSTDGFEYLCSVIEPDQAKNIRRFLLSVIKEHEVRLTPIGKSQWHFVFPQLRPLFLNQRVISKAQELLSSDTIFLWATSLFIKPPRNIEPTLPHQDGKGWGISSEDVVSFWIPLQDCSESLRNGTFQVFDRPLELDYFEVRSTGGNQRVHGQHSVIDLKETPISLSVGAGDAIVFHPRLLHCSEFNYTDVHRVAVAVRLISPKCRHFSPVEMPMTVVRLSGTEDTGLFKVVDAEKLPRENPEVTLDLWTTQVTHGSQLIKFRDSAARNWRDE